MSRILSLPLVVLVALAVGLLLGIARSRPTNPPVAHGQAAGGQMLMAASNTQNEAMCFLYNTSTKQLVSYVQRPAGGLQLRGIRTCDADFHPGFVEHPKSDSPTSVRKMRELAEKLGSGTKQ